ncbi:alpha/beta hydrolase [Lichenicola cladoniae]|uniref:Alpha/beta hydrolase n=1 Tax=Lichenicola cladoniae TaxID=1484109 RepID=A0A6M8HTD9_9PROT|nr:alpha/beta hydrolase [Lichenicola cladoniae]NPD65305.1 alpha/beta hydrolase [Acetobacteraceae bacterium]QKE91602.1 alpha/beta hydrolase [Lichenicola cladoniae]
MTTRHLIDPELLVGLEMFPARSFSLETLPMIRREMLEMGDVLPPHDASLAALVVHRIGAIEVRVFTPHGGEEDTLHPALLHLHGGGYVVGAARSQDAAHASLAAELGCVIASVEYRLAPETPHPGPVEDAYAGLKFLFEEARSLGVDRTRIAVGGESAGGGLAAALALLARDRDEVPIVFQHLIYPMLDDRTGTLGEPHPFAGEFVWTPEFNRFGWASLLGHEPGLPTTSPYAAPARAADLSRLPPAFISVGALDLFIDEDVEYARRLVRAGVPTELHVFPGAFHGFDMVPTSRTSAVARNRSRAALRRALHPR